MENATMLANTKGCKVISKSSTKFKDKGILKPFSMKVANANMPANT